MRCVRSLLRRAVRAGGSGPQSVLTLAKDFDRCARDLRDLIIEGADIQAQSRESMQKYLDALRNCQNLWITRYTLAG